MLGSFNYDKKKEHEKLAAAALKNDDLRLAFHHTCQAAMYTFLLAKATHGRISEIYLQNANGLLAAASNMKKKINSMAGNSNDNNGADTGDGDGGLFQTINRPQEKLADVAGMEQVKQQFIDMAITRLQHPDLADKYRLKKGGGVLLYGPPGTGKTFIVRALAGELNAAFFVVKSSDIISKWAGESEVNVRKLFAEARKHPLSVIFIDEIDALSPDRNSPGINNHEGRLVNALLEEIDGFAAKEQPNTLLLIGATNRPGIIDSAFMRPNRFDIKIRVDLPDFQSRRKIFELFFKKRSIDIAPELLDMLASRTDNFNCADVDHVAQQAVALAFKKEIAARENNESLEGELFTAAFFNEVLQNVSSSVSKRDIELIEQWEKENNLKK